MANEFYYTAPTHIDVNVKTPTCIHLFARDAPITNPASHPPLGSLPLFRYTKDEIGQGVGSCPLREDSLQFLFTESPHHQMGPRVNPLSHCIQCVFSYSSIIIAALAALTFLLQFLIAFVSV
jgi:hypothetical protein